MTKEIKASNKKTQKPKVTVKAKATKILAPLYNQKGEKLRSISLPENIFGQKANNTLVAMALRVYLANKKANLASTKVRSEVSGGGRKPHRQKGTGKARAGSTRSPGRRGGGIVFGPKPRDTKLKLNKKMRQKALILTLSDKHREDSIAILDKLNFKEPKTKKADLIIKKITGDKRSSRIVVEEKNPTILKSFRNLRGVDISLAVDLNPLNVLQSSSLIFTQAALEKLKNRFGENSDESN